MRALLPSGIAATTALLVAACGAEPPPSLPGPGPDGGARVVVGGDSGLAGTTAPQTLADGAQCPLSCSMLACGRYACYTQCLPGSGCTDCAGRPCGSGVCSYGSGCLCAGQPCVSSGCPPGTGCLP